MIATEVAGVVALIGSLDHRVGMLTQDEIRAKVTAWHSVLRKSMTFEFATRAVRAHYAGSSKLLAPSDLNTAWDRDQERERKIEQQLEHRRQAAAEAGKGVPMPDHVRALIRQTFGDRSPQPTAQETSTSE